MYRLEGHAMVTASYLRDVLGPSCRFQVHPVIDLAGQAPVDAYEIPDRHRQAVHLMTPADIFPFSPNLSRTMQVDHTIPHDQGGVSCVGNYGPMTTFHHRVKTHGSWTVRQPYPGIYVWRDPHGGFYLVDHTGTRPLHPPQDKKPKTKKSKTKQKRPQKRTQKRTRYVEIYRHLPDIQIDLDVA